MATIHYLITGSTGDTGGAAARQLLARGAKVRALPHAEDHRTENLRDLGAEVVVGDFLNFSSIRGGRSSRNLYGEFSSAEPKQGGDSFTVQHLREVAIDHDNGVFAGTNDAVERIGGQPPTSLEQFIEQHREAFV